MQEKWIPTGLAACLVLGACSGGGGGAGGGGIGSGGSGSLPAPPATNTNIGDLKVSQSFTNDAANNSVIWDKATSTGIQGTASRGTLAISYDSGARAYTVAYAERSQTFAPADQLSDDKDLTVFSKTLEGSTDRLTLDKTAIGPGITTQYTRLGYWQRNTTSSGRQYTDFVSFTYGLATAANAVPRTGTAAYKIGTFGMASTPGGEPRSFSGSGTFSVDLGQGLFYAHSYLSEQALVTGSGTVGGGIELTAGGSLSSSDNGFSGNVSYGGSLGNAGGTLAGRFYGPNAEELGATFLANNSAGLSVSGSFVGQKDATATPDNFTLTNLGSQQLFYTRYGTYSTGQLTWQNSETFTVSPYSSEFSGGQFTLADKVASSNANFTTYRKTFNNLYDPSGTQTVVLEMYKPGSGNSELALTYASFGHWATTSPFSTANTPVDQYFAYGFLTPNYMLGARTGTAQYDGVVYGAGNNSSAGARYAVSGTSRFMVDFTALQLTGSLSLAGKVISGSGGDVNFGAFDFAGKIAAYGSVSDAQFKRDTLNLGSISVGFYGPDAREIAAPFSLNVPTGVPGAGTSITGIAVAKQR